MRRYILKRLLQLIPVLLGVTFLSFAMMRLAGSDAITELYGDKGAVSQEIIDAKRAELGLDRPFLSQYFSWLGGLLTGDMGTSYVSGRDVFGAFVSRLPATSWPPCAMTGSRTISCDSAASSATPCPISSWLCC